QFRYRDGDDYVFMDLTTFDQVVVPSSVVGDAANYLLENDTAQIAISDGTPLYLKLPATVVWEVRCTEPGLQADRSSGRTKPATVETGLEIQVPLFIDEGTKVRVDTKNGEYQGRATD